MSPGLVIAGIGASAGGLGALTRLVSALPRNSGLAYIVLQHQAESQAGKLARILAPLSPVAVVDVEEGISITADHIYVVPPHTRATLVDGTVALEPTGSVSPRRPIDALFSSLAERLGDRAIGVVLSGTGDDGTAGLRAIRTAGGVTAAQDPSTAEHDEMPRSAIAAGVVDIVWPVERLAREISQLRRGTAPAITRILDQLRELSGIDFTTYKRATVERRLDRQLARHHLASLDEYAAYLAERPAEARVLYEDLLVHVTEFFRDAPIFDLIRSRVVPELLAAKPADAAIRAWVPGCSTGEEAYSIAIVLLDALAELGDSRPIQIFATDLSERAIELARAGRYPPTIRAQVGEERIARYFVPDGDGIRVATKVRERCVFVRHDLAIDPPFSKLDLVSCRNVLIYLGPALQKRVVPLFHYALEQPGFLLLGTSESIADHDALFAQVEPNAPLYRRKPTAVRAAVLAGTRIATRRADAAISAPDVLREADHVLLARYAPACVLLDENFDVVQFRGRTGAYLEPAPGHPQLNVFKMLRDRLGPEVRTAAMRAQRDNMPVRSEDIEVGTEPHTRRVDVEVIPMRAGTARQHYLVVFEERSLAPPAAVASAVRRGSDDRVGQLEQELAAAREYLATVITQHIATSEELGIVNEELQSTNEELQASNEELMTAKEELQSTNDELASVNIELERGNTELRKTNDDLVNVLASVDIAIIIVDRELHVRRFTPKTRSLFKLIEGDIGRPIADLKPSFTIADLDATIANVIETLAIHEREVRDADGHWYRMHVRPYRTAEQHIGGAVISFVDITVLHESIEAIQHARDTERGAQDVITREKDAFLNAVSHELRTPLSAILLWTEVIRQLAGTQPDIHVAVDTIEGSALAEAQLVEDLLDLAVSRTNSRAVLVAIQPTDPVPIIENVVATLRPSANAKGVNLALELDREARALADPRRLRQILWHLLTNAIKFTPASGRVGVVLARRDGMIELVVADTGKGVHAEFLDSVFEPFSQEDRSSTRAQPGLGIGLAFVRHLVERQHGTIAVASSGAGQGTVVTVRLPPA